MHFFLFVRVSYFLLESSFSPTKTFHIAGLTYQIIPPLPPLFRAPELQAPREAEKSWIWI
jgi:hypothetical protein